MQGLAALTACHAPACLLALPAEGGAVRVYDVARGSGGGAGGAGGGGVDVLCELEAHKTPVVSGACRGRRGGHAGGSSGVQNQETCVACGR